MLGRFGPKQSGFGRFGGHFDQVLAELVKCGEMSANIDQMQREFGHSDEVDTNTGQIRVAKSQQTCCPMKSYANAAPRSEKSNANERGSIAPVYAGQL